MQPVTRDHTEDSLAAVLIDKCGKHQALLVVHHILSEREAFEAEGVIYH